MPPHSSLACRVVVVLAGAWLTVGQAVVVAQVNDLDTLSNEQLSRALDAELRDVTRAFRPWPPVSARVLVTAILEALSDDGDTGDETLISRADLDAEFEEAKESPLDEVLRMLLRAGVDRFGDPVEWSRPRVWLTSLAQAFGGPQSTAPVAVRQTKGYVTWVVQREPPRVPPAKPFIGRR